VTRLCNAPTVVEGAHGCPRTKGHAGQHLWWVTWEIGPGNWQAIVYSGEPQERTRRCRGRFSASPDAEDIHLLLLTLSPMRKREQARRTPHSAPEPVAGPMRVERLDNGLAVVVHG